MNNDQAVEKLLKLTTPLPTPSRNGRSRYWNLNLWKYRNDKRPLRLKDYNNEF